ncbi:MAG: terpene cyclase/mutase family protein [Candidatus Hermodarchaeota archaeon]|nr:terpene cyclase/mutase family protein [Candidatus Hermodarchaeota archaeon]
MRLHRKTGYKLLTAGLFFLLAIGLPFLNSLPTFLVQQSSLSKEKSGLGTLTSSSPYDAQTPVLPPDVVSLPFSFGKLLVVHGDYVNESSQESVEAWTSLLEGMNFNTTAIHITDLTITSDYDLIVVTPSVGTSTASFGISVSKAHIITASQTPVLLLGYGHEVLDQVWEINLNTDIIPCIESYLWSPNDAFQFFSEPHVIPEASGRFNIYTDHIVYDAYRLTSLPEKTEILGTNALGSGAQILWFRSLPINSHLYYWGIDQTVHLSSHGIDFCENLIHWLLRPQYQNRLGNTLAAFQLIAPSFDDYWAVQGAGGFGYPLEPSLRFTYYVTDIVQTFGLSVNISTFGSWLMSTYNPLQGVFEDLASPQLQDRCITTSMSSLTSDALGILNQFDASQISDYIASCQDPITGGFFIEHGVSQTSLEATRYSVEALLILGQLYKINVDNAVSYVSTCQEANLSSSDYGGFFSSPTGGITASLKDAVDALTILNHFAAVDTINQTALLNFIMACKEPGKTSVFDTKPTLDSDEWILGTSCTLQLLTFMDALELIDVEASRTFILGNQYPNGGWGRGDTLHDFHNSPDETWYAVQALSLTGGLASAKEPLTAYLAQCCTGWGGATEPLFFGDFLTSAQLLSALYQVDAINKINQTAFLDYLNNCWSSARVSFTAHQLPPGVGINSDTPTPDRIALESGTFGPLYHYWYAQLVSILNLTDNQWIQRSDLILQEIEASQTFASGFSGMFGLHHLYVGREDNFTFRFDSTCWSLLAHAALGGHSTDLMNNTAAFSYLQSCLQDNGTHQYFHDSSHPIPFPNPWRFAEGNLVDTWYGLQAWSYLDPGLTGLNGHNLATYASDFLQNNPTLVTTYYAIEILYFLTESGLYPEALTLLNREEQITRLLTSFSYHGLVKEPSIPNGKWTIYLLDLALQTINRLNLLPMLDVNPVLHLTQINYLNGTFSIGDLAEFSASVSESRWNQLPANVTICIQIFDTHFNNSTYPINPGNWTLQETIPAKLGALGPQNLTITAIAPGAIPYYGEYVKICEVWGNITTRATYIPSLSVPQSIPLNVSVQLNLEDSTNTDSQITNGNVILVIESLYHFFTASHHELGLYNTQIPTQDMNPGVYRLQVNASAPYCTMASTTEVLVIIVFTELTITINPIEVEDYFLTPTVEIDVQLRYLNMTETYGLSANLFLEVITQESSRVFHTVLTTNEGGRGNISIPTPSPGIYNIRVKFEGQVGFSSCSQIESFLVKYPQNRIMGIFSSIVLFSLVILILGGIGGILYFLKLQSRLNRFIRLFPTSQNSQATPVHELFSLDEESASNRNDGEYDS